jgi:hypothetical protein
VLYEIDGVIKVGAAKKFYGSLKLLISTFLEDNQENGKIFNNLVFQYQSARHQTLT